MTVLQALSIISITLILVAGCSKGDKELKPRSTAGQVKQQELYEKHFESSRPLSVLQQRDLASICSYVMLALTNEQVSALRECNHILTNNLGHLVDVPYQKALSHMLEESGFLVKQLRGFKSVKEFDDYLSFNIEAAVLLGCSRYLAGGYGYDAVSIDGLVFRSLAKYRDYFKERRDETYGRVVEMYMSRWKDFVESEGGISRRAARRTLAYELERIEIVGDITRADAFIAARSMAQGLINCGYTPTWLDSEFPLPTEK